jgi:drug/metabolite transporter (DMT)-like permease
MERPTRTNATGGRSASTAVAHHPRLAVVYAWLGVGVASVSAAAIFIRLADTEPMTIAAYRMTLAAAFVAVPALVRSRRELRGLDPGDVAVLSLAGLFLAAHMAFWITSLSLTSVASSVLLVTTAPVFVAVASHFFLRERVRQATVIAVVLSLAGGGVLAIGNWDGDGRRLLGDGLALAGAVAVAVYMIVGRRVRGHIGTLPYVTVVYTAAAVVLLALALGSGAPMLGLSVETYLWMGLAALLPQAIGHSLLNWSLAHVSATNVSIAVRGEPIVATLVAIPVLGEVPAWTVVPGGVLVMAGVYLAVRSEAARGSKEAVA